MAQKRSTSVKSDTKAPLKNKAVKSKTTAGKSNAATMAGAQSDIKAMGKSATKVDTTSTQKASTTGKKATIKSGAATTARAKASSKSEAAKSAVTRTSSSRAKIASSAAARRMASKATATDTKAERKTPLKSGKAIKNVAALAKPMVKQSKPLGEEGAPKKVTQKQASGQSHSFKPKEYIVYPAHGVGQIIEIEEQEIAGLSLELFVITFEKDKMTLRVPTNKFESVGMRKLAEPKVVEKAMTVLKGRARIKRTMWSRRAQEYEAKINSGDLISISEVVRDLYRSDSQPEQSYSERQLYEQALDRMSREIAVVEKLDERGAVQRITDVLSKSAKKRQAAEENTDSSEIGSDVEAA